MPPKTWDGDTGCSLRDDHQAPTFLVTLGTVPVLLPVPLLSRFTRVRWYPVPSLALRKRGDPQQQSRPCEMMAVRSPNSSASSI